MDVAMQLKLVRRHPTWRDAGDAVRVFYSPSARRGAMTVKLFGAPSSFGDAECVLGSTYAENVQAIVHSLILAVPKDVYATQFGIQEDGGVLIDYAITQDLLARESDSKRRTVVRALDGLYQANLLKRMGRNYLITSVEALLKHASTTLPNIALKSAPESPST